MRSIILSLFLGIFLLSSFSKAQELSNKNNYFMNDLPEINAESLRRSLDDFVLNYNFKDESEEIKEALITTVDARSTFKYTSLLVLLKNNARSWSLVFLSTGDELGEPSTHIGALYETLMLGILDNIDDRTFIEQSISVISAISKHSIGRIPYSVSQNLIKLMLSIWPLVDKIPIWGSKENNLYFADNMVNILSEMAIHAIELSELNNKTRFNEQYGVILPMINEVLNSFFYGNINNDIFKNKRRFDKIEQGADLYNSLMLIIPQVAFLVNEMEIFKFYKSLFTNNKFMFPAKSYVYELAEALSPLVVACDSINLHKPESEIFNKIDSECLSIFDNELQTHWNLMQKAEFKEILADEENPEQYYEFLKVKIKNNYLDHKNKYLREVEYQNITERLNILTDNFYSNYTNRIINDNNSKSPINLHRLFYAAVIYGIEKNPDNPNADNLKVNDDRFLKIDNNQQLYVVDHKSNIVPKLNQTIVKLIYGAFADEDGPDQINNFYNFISNDEKLSEVSKIRFLLMYLAENIYSNGDSSTKKPYLRSGFKVWSEALNEENINDFMEYLTSGFIEHPKIVNF